MTTQPRDEREPIDHRQAAVLRGLVDAAPIGIGLVRHRILGWVNRQFEALIGYTAAELQGQSARMLYPDDREFERVGNIKHAQVAAHGVGSIETRMLRKDGAVIDVLLSSAALARDDLDAGMVFTVLDITERKRHESILLERDRATAALFANLPGMVYRCRNDAQWTMEFLSEGCRDCTGFAPEAFLGNAEMAYGDLIHPEDRSRVFDEIQSALARGQVFELEYRVVLPGRGKRWFWERGRGLQDADGTLRGLEGFITDITNYKQLVAQTLQTSKLEAIGQLAGGIAHDFNNLLQVINGYAALLADDLAAGRPDPAHLDEIRKAGDRAEKLVRQLLAFSRRQILQPREVDLNELGDGLFAMIKRMLGEHIEFSFSKDPGLGRVNADPAQLEQVLMNLVLNARDAMPGGGRLAVATSDLVLTQEDCRQLSGARPGRHARIMVSDTGEGMDASVLAQVFEPFFTTKEVGKGTGLGLPMVYGIVQQHGGAIGVASEPGRGTTFSVYLPVVDGIGADTAGSVRRDPLAAGGTILVAEDDEAVRRLTRRMLEKAGYTVLVATSGDEAVAVAREHPGVLDLVVLDLVMPGSSGHTTLDILRGLVPDLPILFCTGHDVSLAPRTSPLGDGLACLHKPFTQDALLQEVKRLLVAADRRDPA